MKPTDWQNLPISSFSEKLAVECKQGLLKWKISGHNYNLSGFIALFICAVTILPTVVQYNSIFKLIRISPSSCAITHFPLELC